MARRPCGAVKADEDSLLAFVADRMECGAVALAYRQLAAGVGLTPAQTRRAVRALLDSGQLSVEARFLPNGGQAENVYCVTAAGRERLAARASAAPLP